MKRVESIEREKENIKKKEISEGLIDKKAKNIHKKNHKKKKRAKSKRKYRVKMETLFLR